MLFVPYNYLIDPSARRALNIELAEDVIIFDEAHNMERACTDAASVDLSAAQLVGPNPNPNPNPGPRSLPLTRTLEA